MWNLIYVISNTNSKFLIEHTGLKNQVMVISFIFPLKSLLRTDISNWNTNIVNIAINQEPKNTVSAYKP